MVLDPPLNSVRFLPPFLILKFPEFQRLTLSVSLALFYQLLFLLEYCKDVKCPEGKSCIYDQNGLSYCIHRKCGEYKDCSNAQQKKVCGLDNKTYKSLCHLRAAECKSFQVIPIKYYEACKSKY